MPVFLRFVATLLLVAAIIAVCGGLYKMYVGNYFYHASFITAAMIVIAALVALFLLGRGLFLIIKKKNKS